MSESLPEPGETAASPADPGVVSPPSAVETERCPFCLRAECKYPASRRAVMAASPNETAALSRAALAARDECLLNIPASLPRRPIARGPVARVLGSGDFSIGGHVWPGISKLIEECGEVMQVAGKLMGSRGEPKHWDGTDLKVRIEEEIGDLLAAVDFVVKHNRLDAQAIANRRLKKLDRFDRWHRGEK